MKRPHLAYIAWGYPPARGSGVFRAVATANLFVRAGWRVTVITADRESFEKYTSSDPQLEQLIDPEINVVRVPFVRPYLEDDLAVWSRVRVEFPLVWGALVAKTDRMHFPERYYARWYPAVRKQLKKLHAADPVDLVIGTTNPQVDAGAARALFPQVPYVVDYRDAWTLDCFTGERVHAVGSRESRWEGRLFRDAEEIWFVNDPIREWHAKEYPQSASKMRVVPNGADLDIVPAGHPRERSQELGDGAVRFSYLGTITPQVPLAAFGAGWRQAGAALDGAQAHLYGHLGFFEKSLPQERAMVDELTALDGITFHGPVSKLEVEGVYERADALLFIVGGGRYITSGKVYEYISTGLPIVSVHDLASSASSDLRDYPLWFPAASLEAADIAAALTRAHAAVTNPDLAQWAAAAEFARSTRREATMAPHIQRLREKVAARATSGKTASSEAQARTTEAGARQE